MQNRIRELKKEKIEVKEEKVKRRKQHVHLQYAKTLFLEKLAEMDEVSYIKGCCQTGHSRELFRTLQCERERDRQTDRQTDRQRHRDRKTNRQRDGFNVITVNSTKL